MRRERLKDQIDDPRVSVFDSFVRAVVILVSIGAVYYALSGRGLTPSRPAAPEKTAAPPASEVTLSVTSRHTFYWNREGPFTLGDIRARLAAWRRTTDDPTVTIAAEQTASVDDTLELVNEARRLGVQRVRIRTQPRP